MVKYYLGKGMVWIRIFDHGISIQNRPLKFSERQGLSPYWKLGEWIITILR